MSAAPTRSGREGERGRKRPLGTKRSCESLVPGFDQVAGGENRGVGLGQKGGEAIAFGGGTIRAVLVSAGEGDRPVFHDTERRTGDAEIGGKQCFPRRIRSHQLKPAGDALEDRHHQSVIASNHDRCGSISKDREQGLGCRGVGGHTVTDSLRPFEGRSESFDS